MRLTDCFMELVAYVAYFRKSVAKRQPPFDKVKKDIQDLISKSEEFSGKENLPQEDFIQARFAIFAWIDETILSSQWREKDRWLGEQLQRLYHNTADAGEIFFERLNSIGLHQRDVREVYYLCLVMGFMGRYCHPGDEYLLDQLKTANLKLLVGNALGMHVLEKEGLFPEAYASQSVDAVSFRPKRRIPAFTMFCLGFPVFLFTALFVIYSFIMTHIAKNLLSTVP